MQQKLAIIATAFAGLLASAAPAAQAAPANYAGASSDDAVVYFTTTDKLVPGDTDNKRDVYERSFDQALDSYVTREVSTGPTGGNDSFDAFFDGNSADGSKAFFSTEESLVPADTDRSEDVYQRDIATGATTLVSSGDASCSASKCGNGAQPAIFFDVSADGTRVELATSERLSSADTDGAVDLYARDIAAGTTTLVSAGSPECAPVCGNGSADALFQGASADGTKVFFATTEALVLEDSDEIGDLYERDLEAGTTLLVSRPGTCPPLADCTPAFGGTSSDGSRVFYETNERIGGLDTDSGSDVYEWTVGGTNLVSIGPGGGNGGANARYEASSADGTAIFFETSESLVTADTDATVDVYQRSGGTTTRVSTGPAGGNANLAANFAKASASGGTVLFTTAEALTSDDGDAAIDLYSRTGGTTTLVSTSDEAGDGAFDVSFAGASGDAGTVLFETAEPLLASDGDARPDIYERAAGQTRLVSTGPVGHNGAFTPNLADVSANGTHAIFITEERLAEGDLDTERDVYDHSESGTLLVSVGNSIQLGPPTPALTGTDPPSPNPSTHPSVLGQAEAGTAIKIYTTADCSGAPVGTGSSAELGEAGIPVTVEADATTVLHGTATDANGDTSACSSSFVTYRQAPEAPPQEEGGGGDGGTGDGGTSGGSTGGGTAAPPPTKPKTPSGGKGDGSGGAVAPQTKVTFAPLFTTRSRRPVIRFVDSTGQAGTQFSCKVDKQRWQPCHSPVRLKKLSYARHAFRVIGVNSGIRESKPIVRRFKVVRR